MPSDAVDDGGPTLEYEKWKTVVPGRCTRSTTAGPTWPSAAASSTTSTASAVTAKTATARGRQRCGCRPKPRDFGSGIYKFRSTDSGSLPLEARPLPHDHPRAVPRQHARRSR